MMTLFNVGLDVTLGKSKKIEMGVEHFNIVAECADDAITGAKNYVAAQYRPRLTLARLHSVLLLEHIDLIY